MVSYTCLISVIGQKLCPLYSLRLQTYQKRRKGGNYFLSSVYIKMFLVLLMWILKKKFKSYIDNTKSSQHNLTTPLDKVKYYCFTIECRYHNIPWNVREVCYPLGSTWQLHLFFHDILAFQRLFLHILVIHLQVWNNRLSLPAKEKEKVKWQRKT